MVIIITHSLRYAQRNCDRLIWLDKGEVRETGNPKEIVANYRATVPTPVKTKQSLNIDRTETIIKQKPVIEAKNLGLSFKLDKEDFWALRRSKEHTSKLQSRSHL